MIDYAEALTVIDVNSGSFIGRGKGAKLEDTITKINLEAADEVVRQLRLRDIGGIIVIDFIDMERARNRDAVLKTLRKALDEDRTKTFVVEISPLGLVEMTRQNVTEGVREIMTRPCPTCDGEGVIKSEETIAIEFERRMRELATHTDAEALLLQMNPRVSSEFTSGGARVLHQIEAETGKWFHFEGSEGLPLDHFAVLMESDREHVLERALPFREGEEVHVEIVEPHMYSPGRRGREGRRLHHLGQGRDLGCRREASGADRGGRPNLGGGATDRRAGCGPRAPRTAAGPGSNDEDVLESTKRRRGRRGGRRRSTAEAGASCGRRSIFLTRLNMYAIVKTGGKQYRVQEGQTMLVERLTAADGDEVSLTPLLYVDGAEVVDGDDVSRVAVGATVLGHERGPKLRIVKFKPKRGYKRRNGHRQELTRIQIKDIKLNGS